MNTPTTSLLPRLPLLLLAALSPACGADDSAPIDDASESNASFTFSTSMPWTTDGSATETFGESESGEPPTSDSDDPATGSEGSEATSDETGGECPEGEPGCACGDTPACTPPAVCDLDGDEPVCLCDELDGLEGEGGSCSDIDECEAGTHDCDPDAACLNTHGAFECFCLPGFGGDGRTCTPLSCATLEDFETGTWGPGWVDRGWASANQSSGRVTSDAAHDGEFGITRGTGIVNTQLALGEVGDRVSGYFRLDREPNGRFMSVGAGANNLMAIAISDNLAKLELAIQEPGQGNAWTSRVDLAQPIRLTHWYRYDIQFLAGAVSFAVFAEDDTLIGGYIRELDAPFAPGGLEITTSGCNGFTRADRSADTFQVCRP